MAEATRIAREGIRVRVLDARAREREARLVEPDQVGQFDLTHWVTPTGGPRGNLVISKFSLN
jgi:hypothetical protein